MQTKCVLALLAAGLAAALAGFPGPAPAVSGGGPDGYIVSPERGWPQWRGPRRDGISREKGLLPSWPPQGPPLLWQAGGLGVGWSSPILAGGRLFITGEVGDDLVIFALDRSGKRLWQAKNGAAWKGQYPGARASCAYAGGRLYHMNAHGRVACLEAATGREVWAVDVLPRFGGRNITWAMSECLLVDGPRVLVTPGGSKALMAALDARTGKTVWTTEPIPGDDATYASPILFRHAGRRLIAGNSSRHGFGVDADTGKLLWSVPCEGRNHATVASPVYGGGSLFYVAPYGPDGALYRLKATRAGVAADPAWRTTLDTLCGGAVLVDGLLFGAGYSRTRHWHCLDWRTGEARHELPDLYKGAAIYADGRLYCLGEDGTAALLRPLPDRFEVLGRFQLVNARRRDVWAHPVLLDGRLYLRYHETLWCYDVRGR
ncbi:MAG: PQQ-like beta-propeller repeat protein [Armatimonadetes bacterium]|nr:PQQ-like beta-propeller repeat protein [Armatimonadota bacterium]